MVPEPVCTTAIANNATTSVIINKKARKPLPGCVVCAVQTPSGRGVVAGTGSAGGAKPSPVPCWDGGGGGWWGAVVPIAAGHRAPPGHDPAVGPARPLASPAASDCGGERRGFSFKNKRSGALPELAECEGSARSLAGRPFSTAL